MPSRLDTKWAAARIVGSERSPFTNPPMQLPLKPRIVATLQFGAEPPKPQPPSPLVWATTGPAHLPVLKEQQPCWQSESWVQASKTVSEPVPAVDEEEEDDDDEPSLSDDECLWCLCGDAPSSPPLSSPGDPDDEDDDEEDEDEPPPPDGKGMLSSCEVNLAAAMTAGEDRSPGWEPEAHTPRLRTVATSQFGAPLPKPHPPSPLVWAMPGPAHLPVLKAQQPCWQSESWEQESKTTVFPRR